MDWNLAKEDNRRMLKHIVALLFSFAGLAQRLSGLPRPVRAFVLRILRSAEAVARDIVFGMALDYGVSAPLPACFDALQDGDSPADAMRLAHCFRVLALLLDWLTERNCGRNERFVTPGTMIALLLAAVSLERRQLFPATVHLAVERRDSS